MAEPISAEHVVAYKKRRAGYRGYVTQVKKDINDVILAGKPTTQEEFSATEATLNRLLKQAELRWKNEDEVNNLILEAISDDEEYSNEMLAQERHKDERLDLRTAVQEFLNISQPDGAARRRYVSSSDSINQITIEAASTAAAAAVQQFMVAAPSPQPAAHVVSTYKPPKLRQFDGNIFEFQSWWESFDANVNSHPTMPTSTKFAFLDECLKGNAQAAVAKVGRIDAHYATAIQILKTRFGNTEAIIDQLIAGLLELKPIRDVNDVASLRQFLDLVETNVGMLTNLGKDQSSYVSIVRGRLVSKLPSELACMWHERPDRLTASMEEFIQFLTIKVVSRESYQLSLISQEAPVTNVSYKKKQGHHSTASELVHTSTSKSSNTRSCVFCKEDHRSADCHLSIARRHELASKEGRCFNCLSKGHMMPECLSKGTCFKCKGKHHTALCRKIDSVSGGVSSKSAHPKTTSSGDSTMKSSSEVKTVTISCLSCETTDEDVLLQTATVLIEDPTGAEHKIVCMLDLGSQRTLIRKALALKLQLVATAEEYIAFAGLGEKSMNPKWRKRHVIKLRGNFPDSEPAAVEALEKDYIAQTTYAVSTEFSRNLFKDGFHLADDRFLSCSGEREEVDLLIGADFYWRIVGREVHKNSNGMAATQSLVGWLLSGPVQSTRIGRSSRATNLAIRAYVGDKREVPALEDLSAFFELEHIGIRDRENESFGQTLSERIDAEIVQKSDGRFQVPLPWKENNQSLSSNRYQAEKRLRSLLNRLSQNHDLFEEYDQQIQTFVKLGYLSEVSSSEPTTFEHYLPHLAVIRPEKKEHRLRIVFDASAKTKNELSLNDCVEIGDNLYPDMLAILLRFGLHPVAWIGDIAKAFLQMELKPEDRPMCRILWVKHFEDPNKFVPVTYQWNRVTFGIASSPFLLAATIRKLLRKFKDLYPETTSSILRNTFVDDWTGGAPSPEIAHARIIEANIIFNDGRFPIGKWTTNSPKLRALLSSSGLLDSTEVKQLTSSKDQTSTVEHPDSKVLGLRWNTDGDFFYFDHKQLLEAWERATVPLTKRDFLKVAAKLFDPVGYLAPLVVRVKMLFQDIWKEKTGWDDPVSTRLANELEEFVKEMEHIKKIKIPRYYFRNITRPFATTQVHVFGDASRMAYGSVAYLRIIGQDGTVFTRFVTSKSRVTPVKGCTMPRLELLAALITARLADYIRSAINLHEWEFFLWTDSTVAQAWMTKTNPDHLLPWVRNRVVEAAKLFPKSVWRHCPGASNPADIVSRGSTVANLTDNKLWWEGPEWLKNQSNWPSTIEDFGAEEERFFRMEVKKKMSININTVQSNSFLLPWNRFGDFNLLVKVVAWMRRFLRRRKQESAMEEIVTVKQVGAVSVAMLDALEIHEAEITAIRCVQRESFPKEFGALEQFTSLPRDSHLVTLHPIYDQEERIMRVTGRVSRSFDHLCIKPPILLPSKHPYIPLLVNSIHLKLHHLGFKATYAEIKKRFWIIKGRSVVKHIISQCVICCKIHSRSFQEKVSDLPIDRVRFAQPFEIVGIDFAGPLYVKAKTVPGLIVPENSPTEIKAYILLFTCAATRALRLELVSDLTTETFILVLRRFIAGCNGTVSVLYSDNAKTFHKAENYLSRLPVNSTVRNFLNGNRIEWRFIVNRAPWWGGFWERMVKTTKDLLRKTLQHSFLPWNDLSTLLKEVEMVINNRPLTYSDEEELTPLTPALLVSGIRSTVVPEKPAPIVDSSISSMTSLSRRERHRLTLLHRCELRWQSEYLHDLTRFQCKTKKGRKIQVNDVVLIFDEKPRLKWKMGVVVKLHKGKDGLTRSVDVKTKNGILSRPVQRLFPTEVRAPGDEATPDQDQPAVQPNSDIESPVPSVEAVSDTAPTGESVGTGPEHPVNKMTRRGRRVKRPERFSD